MPSPSTSPSAVRSRPRASSRRGGFALLITVTLLAFLVLLLVSLASLTRVETQVAANGMQLAQARANALFALNLAMGQLQKYAGPDQAVTARADIDAAVQAALDADKSCNPFWTGVWDARPYDSDPSDAVPAKVTHSTVGPDTGTAKAWLVSGNETNGTAITPADAAVADPETDPNNVWLVHKVLGQDLAAQKPDYPQDGRVKLVKTLIQVPAGQLPGFSTASTTPTPVGAYAWWVGDEGIKAKINLPDPYRAAAVADPETAWRRSAPPRPGLELLDDTKASVLKTAFTATTDAFETKRAGLLAYQQFPMLSTDLATTTGVAQAGRYSNDLTTVGYGVLADTLRGGLRRDLTRGLAATPAAGSTAETEIGDGKEVFTSPVPGSYGRTALGPTSSLWTPGKEPPAPSWDQVRDWFGIRAPNDGSAMTPVSAPLTGGTSGANGTLPTINGTALMPLPVAVQIGYGVDIVDSKLRLTLLPRVVLMNPYNVPLAGAKYTVCYQPSLTNNQDWRVIFSLTHLVGAKETYTATMALADWLPLGRLAFNIEDAFEPGEVRVYSIAPDADNTVTEGLLTLKPGITTSCAYAQTNPAPTQPWFVDPANVRAQLTSMPRDHPRILLSLGESTLAGGALNVPAESLHARYIQTEATYVNPAKAQGPRGIVGTGEAKMLRRLRFSLRDASMDRISNGNTFANYSYVGSATPSDSASGVRILIDQNPRAVISQMVGGWGSVAQYGVTVENGSSVDAELNAVGDNAFWGGSMKGDDYGSSHVILFDILRQNEQIVALGRLGQFNWGVEGKDPAYPLGNSFASIFYQPTDFTVTPAKTYPDFGYALNEALWDRFFMSTLPASLSPRPANLPDSRLKFHDPAGTSTDLAPLEGVNGYQLAATRLMIDGAFNINSTSVEAWTAFLGSVQAADYAYQSRAGAHTDPAVRAFPRVEALHDPDPTAPGQSGNLYEWTGYRRLDATQLKALAVQIVAGIKARARPARSLAEFMNRDLSQPATSVRNQEGIVQAAINAVVNTDTPAADGSGSGVGMSDLPGLNTPKIVAAAFKNGDNPDAARGKLRSAGAPGFLMQSDLLTPLAPAMSARSDTFRVRTYGEARNPVTGEINGRAWCEAVVQRMPEFVGGESAELGLNDASLGSASKTFGRKFVIVQFRWLGPDEI